MEKNVENVKVAQEKFGELIQSEFERIERMKKAEKAGTLDDSMLRDILELTQGLKRQELVPDSVDYGAQNAPVAKYGNVSVIIGDTTKLTRKIERLKAIMPSLEGQSGTLHLESWTEETTNIVFDKSE